MRQEDKLIPIIIPSLDPDERLLALLQNMIGVVHAPIVIVNDGSAPSYDDYYDTAQSQYNCFIIKHDTNLGKGRALKDAFDFCLKKWPEITGVVTADSDGQHTPESIEKCRQILNKNPNNLILGVRDFSGESIPWKSRFGNTLTQKVCKTLCGVKVQDTQTGLRGIPVSFMRSLLDVPGERFEFETRMLIATKGNVDITEFPIETIYDSKDNHVTHFRPVIDSIIIYKIFFEMLFRFLVSSLSSSVIDLMLFSVFCSILRNTTSTFYVSTATILARVVSATYNYLINYHFVFKSQAKHPQSATRYVLLAIIQMLCSAGLTTLGVYLLPDTLEVAIKIIVDTCLFFISYGIQREFVYKKTVQAENMPKK